jgi:hypothetical protein
MQAHAAAIAQFLTMLKLKDKLWHFKPPHSSQERKKQIKESSTNQCLEHIIQIT